MRGAGVAYVVLDFSEEALENAREDDVLFVNGSGSEDEDLVKAGIDNARGEILVFMDGDMQNDPHDIPRLLQSMDAGYEVVSGWRKNREDEASRVLPVSMTTSMAA